MVYLYIITHSLRNAYSLTVYMSVNYLWTLFFSLLLLSVSPCQSCPSHYAMATHLCILGVILFCLLFILLLQISNICWIFNIFAVFFAVSQVS